MTASATPPRWAEGLLRLVVRCADVESISGDLLEEYRDSIYPTRGRGRADAWYAAQVLGFVWRSAGLWAVAFSAAFLARTALDWLAPPADFHTRSTVTTMVAAGLLLSAGFWAGWRSGSFAAGFVAGLATAAMAAVISVVGVAILAPLVIWHDPGTIAAIGASGGLEEDLTLPLFMPVPGALLGTIGGLTSACIRRLRAA